MKKIPSLLFVVIIIFSLPMSVFAVSTVRENGVFYVISGNGEKTPYSGWTAIGGERTYYYKNGVRVTGLRQIDGIVYKFSKDGKNTGIYTGKAKKNGEVVYIRKGKILEFTTEPKKIDGSDFFDLSDYKELMTEKMGGGWIKLQVRIDKVYRNAYSLYPDYSIYEGQEGYVYVPAMAANLVLEADGFCLSNDVIVDEMNYNNIIPIIDGKLKFYTQDDLVNLPEDFMLNNDGVSSVKDRKIGEMMKLSDGMALADFDLYKELTFIALTVPEPGNDPILSYIAGADGFNFRCTIIQ